MSLGRLPQARQQKRIDLTIAQHRHDVGEAHAGPWIADEAMTTLRNPQF
ncbi:MAG: hypothetical protein M3R24_09780 [Chloroflexota bacterium]|nr:hypothetical protein [Chloroflexota bacterium]